MKQRPNLDEVLETLRREASMRQIVEGGLITGGGRELFQDTKSECHPKQPQPT